jgi:hypothetical protein
MVSRQKLTFCGDPTFETFAIIFIALIKIYQKKKKLN